VSRNSVGFDHYVQSGSTTNINYEGTELPIQLRERFVIDGPKQHLRVSAGVDMLAVPARVDAQSPPAFKANQVPDPFVQRRLLCQRAQGEPHEHCDIDRARDDDRRNVQYGVCDSSDKRAEQKRTPD
jgi:hypothetical protein